jgi:hypothetical protein
MSDKSVTFSVFVKDYLSKEFGKMSTHAGGAMGRIRRGLGGIRGESQMTSRSLGQIDRELKQLSARRIKLHVDSSELKKVNREIKQLQLEKRRLETTGTGTAAGGKGGGMGMMGKLGLGGMAIGALYKGARFLSGSVGEFDAQAKQDAAIEAGLKSTGGASGKTLQELKMQARALEKITLFGGDATASAQAMMLTFTGVKGDVFSKSIPLIQDMATRMGGGPDSLATTAIQVGKALNDPIQGVSALRRVGVQMTEQQEKQIKTFMELGQVANAQKIILKELETQFGGSAQAAAKAGMGGITILKNQLGEITERVGGSIVDVIIPLGKLGGAMLKMKEDNPVNAMMQEKSLFIELSKQAINANIPLDRRKEILKEMSSMQPAFLKGLDIEQASYADIAKSLGDTVALYDKRIEYLKAEVTAQTEIAKAQEYRDSVRKMIENDAKRNADSFDQQSDKWSISSWLFNSLRSVQNNNNDFNRIMSGGISSILEATLGKQLDKMAPKMLEIGNKMSAIQDIREEYMKAIIEAGQTGDKTMLKAIEEKIKAMGYSELVLKRLRQKFSPLLGKSPFLDANGNPVAGKPNTPPTGDPIKKELENINSGGVSVKQITINLDSLIRENTNVFEPGQGPADATDFTNKLTDALQTVVSDVNYL